MTEIINFCPTCGSPVYGKRQLADGEDPIVQRTCACYQSPQSGHSKPKSILDYAPKKDIKDTMHTK